MASLSRRSLIGSAGCTVAAGIAAMSVGKPALAVEAVSVEHDPDGPLLALCARFLELQAALDHSYAQEHVRFDAAEQGGAKNEQLHALEVEAEASRDPLIEEQRELLDEMGDLSASTLAGKRARARVVMAWYSLDADSEGHMQVEWYHLEPLFRDLLGEAM